MIDKMLGSDEELRAKRKQWGGELVSGDADSDPSTAEAGSTVPASLGGHIEQSATDGNEGESSSYEEDYTDDFHEILEDVIRVQADLEEDRDDDPDLNESDAVVPQIRDEESKGEDPLPVFGGSQTAAVEENAGDQD